MQPFGDAPDEQMSKVFLPRAPPGATAQRKFYFVFNSWSRQLINLPHITP